MNHACPRCGTTTSSPGRCTQCARPENQRKNQRPTATVYQSKRWRQLRAKMLQHHQWCRCGRLATTIHHIEPFTGPTDPLAWEPTNLRAMCATCHGHIDGKRAVPTRRLPATHAA